MKTSCSVCGSRRLELPAGGRKDLNPGPKWFRNYGGAVPPSQMVSAPWSPFLCSAFLSFFYASRLAAALGDQFQKPKLRGIGQLCLARQRIQSIDGQFP